MGAAGDVFSDGMDWPRWGNWEEYDHEVCLSGGIVAALPVYPHTLQYIEPENFSSFQEKDT